jgi:glycosyltransferase involved in cell wall biosynthesis
MPRVAMLIQRYYPHAGGAERQIQSLAPRLRAHGFEPSVITRHESGLSRFAIIDGVPVYRVLCPGPKPLAAIFYIFSAIRLISTLRPDLIHAHEILSPASAAVLAKILYGRPVLVKILRGGILGDIYKIKNRFLGMHRFRFLSRRVDSFVVISEEIDRELSALGVPPEKRTFIPNGVDTKVFAPVSDPQKQQLRAELGLPSNVKLVIYLGRLTAEKRVDQLLRIWPEIRAAFPEVCMLIVGTGSEEPRLRQISVPGVQFTGQVDDTLRYLQAADVFVLPSATEGLSNSMLEALSTGLPVLATSVGGTPDVISHDVNGYLIPPDDLNELKTGLMTLLADEALCARLGRGGRQRILQEFSLDSIASQLNTLYQRLLES